jgi:hypothetical protein
MRAESAPEPKKKKKRQSEIKTGELLAIKFAAMTTRKNDI